MSRSVRIAVPAVAMALWAACSNPGEAPVDRDAGVDTMVVSPDARDPDARDPDARVDPPDAMPDALDAPDAMVPPDAPPFSFGRCETPAAPLPPLVEDRTVYAQDPLGVWTVRVSVTDLAGLAAVNAGVEDAEVAALFQDDTFGAGATLPNATLKIRGGASRQNAQKNYKVELASGVGRWHGQKEINLNKHMWDLTRVRNKMAFDIFATIADFISLRTQFVHMFVNGEDYGLYTWIEEPDKRFLESHGLDPMGQLYKANNFFFQPISAATAADPIALEEIIEAKAHADDAKLLRMVAAVNDDWHPIDDVVATYFNRDNLVTWLAINVLLNNIDSRTQNFYLYSPSSCEGWYFLPWDYDGAWGFYGQLEEDDRERWESGLSNWWAVILFQRFFMEPANVRAVHDKIVALSQSTLTDAVTAARLASYHDLVLPYISTLPDLTNLPGHHGNAPPSVGIALWEGEQLRITSTVSRFLAEFLAVIERPMPVFTSTNLNLSPMLFHWDDSYDPQGDPIRYDFQISTTPQFAAADVVVEQLGLDDDDAWVAPLPSGIYFWRLIIRDQLHPDAWQAPFHPYRMITIP